MKPLAFHALPALKTFGCLVALFIAWAIAGALMLSQSGCLTPAQQEQAKHASNTVLAAEKTACVIANAFFPDSKVAEVCGLIGPEVELAKALLASTRAAGAARPRTRPVRCAEFDGAVACAELASPTDAAAE